MGLVGGGGLLGCGLLGFKGCLVEMVVVVGYGSWSFCWWCDCDWWWWWIIVVVDAGGSGLLWLVVAMGCNGGNGLRWLVVAMDCDNYK